MDHQSFTAFVAGSAYLFLKMFGNTGVQVYGRFRYKTHKYPEDKVFFGVPADRDKPQPELLLRADAAWRNDLETIPMFIVAALCGLLAGVPSGLYAGLVFLFCVARTVQTAALLLAKQPWRGLGYGAGLVSTGMMFVLSLRQLGW